jgi:predicted HTH domain antitoxin
MKVVYLKLQVVILTREISMQIKNAKVTITKAAELAGMDIYDFMAACKQNQVPVIDISKEELL